MCTVPDHIYPTPRAFLVTLQLLMTLFPYNDIASVGAGLGYGAIMAIGMYPYNGFMPISVLFIKIICMAVILGQLLILRQLAGV